MSWADFAAFLCWTTSTASLCSAPQRAVNNGCLSSQRMNTAGRCHCCQVLTLPLISPLKKKKRKQISLCIKSHISMLCFISNYPKLYGCFLHWIHGWCCLMGRIAFYLLHVLEWDWNRRKKNINLFFIFSCYLIRYYCQKLSLTKHCYTTATQMTEYLFSRSHQLLLWTEICILRCFHLEIRPSPLTCVSSLSFPRW